MLPGKIKERHPYKIDIAIPSKMIAIEVDGMSHLALERKEQDRRKDLQLTEKGWKVVRLLNQFVLNATKEELLFTIYR
jgi:very-short-patch-repair endonuclease